MLLLGGGALGTCDTRVIFRDVTPDLRPEEAAGTAIMGRDLRPELFLQSYSAVSGWKMILGVGLAFLPWGL